MRLEAISRKVRTGSRTVSVAVVVVLTVTGLLVRAAMQEREVDRWREKASRGLRDVRSPGDAKRWLEAEGFRVAASSTGDFVFGYRQRYSDPDSIGLVQGYKRAGRNLFFVFPRWIHLSFEFGQGIDAGADAVEVRATTNRPWPWVAKPDPGPGGGTGSP